MLRSALAPLVVFSASILTACSGGRDVHGSLRSLRIQEDGTRQFTDEDIRNGSFATYVQKAADEFEESVGQGYSYGFFIVEDVTEDEYYLRVGGGGGAPEYFLSDSDDIDLSLARAGRITVRPLIPQTGTSLALDLQNLAPWQQGDELEISS